MTSRISVYLQKNKISQLEVARRLRVNSNRVNQWCTGAQKVPSQLVTKLLESVQINPNEANQYFENGWAIR